MASDIPKLKAMQGEFPYPDLNERLMLEAIQVAVDEDNEPLMACAAKRMVELYLWCGEFHNPMAKMLALRSMHEAVAKELRVLGYKDANAFIPPQIAVKFGKRLQRSFGWTQNWASWCKGF